MQNILLRFIPYDVVPFVSRQMMTELSIKGRKSARENSRLLRPTPRLTGWHNLAGFNNTQPTDTPLNLIKVGQRETAALTSVKVSSYAKAAGSSLLKAKRP